MNNLQAFVAGMACIGFLSNAQVLALTLLHTADDWWVFATAVIVCGGIFLGAWTGRFFRTPGESNQTNREAKK